MASVLDLILGKMGQGGVDQIAQKIGADRKQTESAISAALPTMIEALGRSTDKKTSVEDLYKKLGMGAANSASARTSASSFGDVLPPGMRPAQSQSTPSHAAQTQAPANPFGESAGSISDVLGGLFGQKKERVEKSIGKTSGLNSDQIGPLIAMLGPLVLGAVASKASASKEATTHDVLQEERENIRKSEGGSSFLGSMFDQDGDGDFDMADVMKFGMSKLFGRK